MRHNVHLRFSMAMRDLIEFLFLLNGSQQHIVENLPKDHNGDLLFFPLDLEESIDLQENSMKVKMLNLLQPYQTLQLFKALCILSFWPVVRRKLTSSQSFHSVAFVLPNDPVWDTYASLWLASGSCAWKNYFSALQWCAVDPSPILVLFSNLFREVRQFSFLLPLFGVVDVYIDNQEDMPGFATWKKVCEIIISLSTFIGMWSFKCLLPLMTKSIRAEDMDPERLASMERHINGSTAGQ